MSRLLIISLAFRYLAKFFNQYQNAHMFVYSKHNNFRYDFSLFCLRPTGVNIKPTDFLSFVFMNVVILVNIIVYVVDAAVLREPSRVWVLNPTRSKRLPGGNVINLTNLVEVISLLLKKSCIRMFMYLNV